MQRIFTIRRFVSITLLLLIVFSSTPTQFLHKVFAHHAHKKSATNLYSKITTAATNVNTCQCENTFIDVTYIPTNLPFYNVVLTTFGYTNSTTISTLSQNFFSVKSLRAPPSEA